MKKIAVFICCALFSLISAPGLADEGKTKTLEAIEVLTGFSSGKLQEKKSYRLIPLFVDFDLDLKPLIRKLNLDPKQLIQFQIEPYISYVSSPQDNVETGLNFMLKVGVLPQTSKFQPYLKAGAGLLYMSQHTREQGTQFNFNEQVGVGLHYFLTKGTYLTIEGRYRHLSNCSIKRPNRGIENYFALAGLSYEF
jgi:hypothetical protein